MSLFKSASLVSLLTLASRITGLVRELLMAATFGASAMTDAFNVAFRIPNLLRRLFAEGAFSQAFVPVLAGTRAQEGDEATRRLVDDLLETMYELPGLEGVVAFETQIAEPDRDGGSLRYRGVDIEDLVGRVSFGNVWGLLVDNEFNPGLPPAEPYPIPVHSGDVRVDVQSAIAMLAPGWGLKPLLDIDDDTARENLAHVSVMAMSFVAQAARGLGVPMVPQTRIDDATTIVERFMTRWRGEPDPRHVQAVDAYFVSAAEHGMNASTFTARVIASTGADAAACLSGAIGARLE